MPYGQNVPKDQGEFSGGPGIIDPVRRKDRTLSAEERLKEVYATNPGGGAPEGKPDPLTTGPAEADLYNEDRMRG
jgi:hypothetical protein